MKTISKKLIEDAYQLESKIISFTGIVKTIRSQKKYTFVEVAYGDFYIQVITPTRSLTKLTTHSFVKVSGELKKLPEGKTSFTDYEVVDAEMTVLSLASETVPSMCPPDSSSDVKLTQRLFYLRDLQFVKILKLHDKLCKAFRDYFSKTKCTEITPPSFTSVECEGGATLFSLTHPGKSASENMQVYLTQSSQFALEYALPGVGDCYCLAPSFRAEHSHTRRHLTEFLHGEAEWGGILTFDDHVQKLKDMLCGILDEFLICAKDELISFKKYDSVLQKRKMCDDILILTHQKAIEMCKEYSIYKDEDKKEHFSERDDIPEMQERALIDKIGKIVFLSKFPREFKSFYMGLDPEDESRVLGVDVEVPGVGEIIGSGVRESDYDRLLARLQDAGLKPEDYSEYLDLRKSGFCMTSGMGLGMGRILCWLLDVSSIRDVTAYPRFPGYARP